MKIYINLFHSIVSEIHYWENFDKTKKIEKLSIFLEDFDKHLQIIIPKCRIKFNLLNSANKNYTPPYGCYYYCYKMNFEKDLIFI